MKRKHGRIIEDKGPVFVLSYVWFRFQFEIFFRNGIKLKCAIVGVRSFIVSISVFQLVLLQFLIFKINLCNFFFIKSHT